MGGSWLKQLNWVKKKEGLLDENGEKVGDVETQGVRKKSKELNEKSARGKKGTAYGEGDLSHTNTRLRGNNAKKDTCKNWRSTCTARDFTIVDGRKRWRRRGRQGRSDVLSAASRELQGKNFLQKKVNRFCGKKSGEQAAKWDRAERRGGGGDILVIGSQGKGKKK